MHQRSVVITTAVLAGFVLGIILGPSVRGSSASAQTEPPAQAQSSTRFSELRNMFLDKLAAALNIQRSALDSAITSAGTGTVDQALQQGTLTQEQADAILPRIQSGDVGPLFGGRGFGHRRGGMGRELFGVGSDVRQAMFDAAANALNITPDELRTQLRNGQTVAQLAQAHNTTEQAVTDAALAAARARLDQAVAAGTLTQAQADALYARLEQKGLRFGHPRGRRGNKGQPAVPATPQTPLAAPNA